MYKKYIGPIIKIMDTQVRNKTLLILNEWNILIFLYLHSWKRLKIINMLAVLHDYFSAVLWDLKKKYIHLKWYLIKKVSILKTIFQMLPPRKSDLHPFPWQKVMGTTWNIRKHLFAVWMTEHWQRLMPRGCGVYSL